MQEKDFNSNTDSEEEFSPDGKFLFIAFIAAIFSAVFFGLMFSPLKVYSLICATLFAFVSIAFLEKQKKKGVVKYYLAVKIFAYLMLCVCLLVFAGGIIYAALQG